MMRPSDVLWLAAAILVGGLLGSFMGGGVFGIALGMILGVVSAVIVLRFGVRLAVAVPVLLGTIAGALIGRNVVRVICLPDSCPGLEVTAALLAGVGALVGVGLVVALVARSFDEYWEAAAQQGTPPEAGMGTDEESEE